MRVYSNSLFNILGSVGGVCETRKLVNGVYNSLNCGIVTIISYQTRISELLTSITFAHEVGHSFGSQVIKK